MSSRPVEHYSHCRIAAVGVQKHLAVPLVAEHTVADNSYCMHYVAVDPRCNTRRIHLERKKMHRLVVAVATGLVGFGNHRMGFASMEPAG